MIRHGRACPGHPRLAQGKDVDARPKAGHDGWLRVRGFRRTLAPPRRLVGAFLDVDTPAEYEALIARSLG